MRKLMVLAILTVGLAVGGGGAQEMPEEIQAFLDSYLKDSTVKKGPLYYKDWGVIPASVELKDVRVRAFQVYEFKKAPFNEYPDNVALSEIIFPTFLWRVLVMAHNKPLYEFILNNKTGEPKSGRVTIPAPIGSEFKDHLWVPLLKAYPESTGIKPVLIAFGMNLGFPQPHHLLYFPQLGPRKIYYSDRRGFSDLDTLLTASIETLDDSKTLIKYLKKREASEKAKPVKLEKTSAAGSNDDATPKEFSAPPIYMRGSLRGGGDGLYVSPGGK